MKKSHNSRMRLIRLLLRENWPDAETLAESQSSVEDFHVGFPMPENSNCFHSLHGSCDAHFLGKELELVSSTMSMTEKTSCQHYPHY